MKKVKIISIFIIIAMILTYCTKVFADPAVGDKQASTLWPTNDTKIDLGTFTYPTANSLGSVAKYAVFSMLYNKNMHMEGTIATAEMNFLTNDAFGITSAIEEYTDPNESFIYIGGITEGSIVNFQDTNQVRTSTLILPDDVKFIRSYKEYAEVWEWDSDAGTNVKTGYDWVERPINNGNGIVFESDGYYSKEFSNVTEIQQSVKHESETTYVIDFEKAFQGLAKYADSHYSKSTEGDDNFTQVTIDDEAKKINVVCTKEKMNIINLTAEQIENYDINIVCTDDNGDKTQDFSVIINVKDISGDHTFDRHVTVNGKSSEPYGETGGRILWNFGSEYSGTTIFSKTDLGMILAPNASIRIVDISHDGSVWAKNVENTRAEIHQNYFKQYKENEEDNNDNNDDNNNNQDDPSDNNNNNNDNNNNNQDDPNDDSNQNNSDDENNSDSGDNSEDDTSENDDSKSGNDDNKSDSANDRNSKSVKTEDTINNYVYLMIIASIIYLISKSKVKANRYIPKH